MDVAKASTLMAIAAMDAQEVLDPSSAAFSAQEARKPGRRLTVAIDATWLGPHETGAQVLTTAAITAMAADERVAAIYVVGIKELPSYARHLADLDSVRIVAADEEIAQCDIVWYPNQIDGRSNIGDARALGRRVVTTYLDLIAYDIPRYHGSPEAWGTYRALQRRIALSVDGITAISADVANRLLTEVPRLDPQRVQPLPLMPILMQLFRHWAASDLSRCSAMTSSIRIVISRSRCGSGYYKLARHVTSCSLVCMLRAVARRLPRMHCCQHMLIYAEQLIPWATYRARAALGCSPTRRRCCIRRAPKVLA
jgi:hypothetical protein